MNHGTGAFPAGALRAAGASPRGPWLFDALQMSVDPACEIGKCSVRRPIGQHSTSIPTPPGVIRPPCDGKVGPACFYHRLLWRAAAQENTPRDRINGRTGRMFFAVTPIRRALVTNRAVRTAGRLSRSTEVQSPRQSGCYSISSGSTSILTMLPSSSFFSMMRLEAPCGATWPYVRRITM